MKPLNLQILNYLKEPYPYYYGNQNRLLFLLVLLSILSFCFSYTFEPFEVNITEHKINSYAIIFIHAFVPLPISYIYLKILDNNLPKNFNWTLGKEILHLSIILLIIGTASFLIRDFIYLNDNNWSLRYFWEELRNTFLIGFLLLIIVLPLNLERLIKKHKARIKKINASASEKLESTLVTLKNSDNQNIYEFRLNEFVFAKVESNYTEVFTFTHNKLLKELIRIPLKELEAELKPYEFIYKTHRSYLVNLNAIENVTGNAQGFQLQLKNCSHSVPVSRTNITNFNTTLNNLV